MRMRKQALPSINVPTQWDLTYLIVKSSLPYKEAFNKLAKEDTNFTKCPSADKWDQMEAMKDSIFNSGLLLTSV